jgi:hypothetical protein
MVGVVKLLMDDLYYDPAFERIELFEGQAFLWKRKT